MKHASIVVVAAILAIALHPSGSDAVDPDITPDQAARQLVRSQIAPSYMEDVYQLAAQVASSQFQGEIQPILNRPLTDSEKQRLLFFWHAKMKEAFSYSTLEDLLAPIVTKHLTVSEMQEINRFYSTPVGRKMADLTAVLAREAQVAAEELAMKIADPEWVATTMEELKAHFPQWFPALESEEENP